MQKNEKSTMEPWMINVQGYVCFSLRTEIRQNYDLRLDLLINFGLRIVRLAFSVVI